MKKDRTEQTKEDKRVKEQSLSFLLTFISSTVKRKVFWASFLAALFSCKRQTFDMMKSQLSFVDSVYS